MAWPDWPKDDAKGLARYILPHVGERLELDIVRDDALRRGDRLAVVSAVYRALLKLNLRYARELYHPDDQVQRIRDPGFLVNGGGDATCLDLALLFAGACMGNDLVPLVVLVDGHAFVAVSLADDRREAVNYARVQRDGGWIQEGLLAQASRYEQLVADGGGYVAVECTGFARSDEMPPEVPEGRGRAGGLLDFEAAVAAARSQTASRQFQQAVDPCVLHQNGYSPYAVDTRSLPENLRSRLDSIFKQHARFGGRANQLAALDGFLASRRSGCLLVTGDSGSGKTALLATWIRTLQARSDLRVAYHFVNRQQRLQSERDFLRLLCQQIKFLQGEGTDIPSDQDLLEVMLARFLAEGLSWQRLVVVVDGVDEAEDWTPERHVPAHLADQVYIVLSARRMADRDWIEELGLSGRADTLTLGALGREDIADLLRKAGSVAAGLADQPDFVRELERCTNGDAFYLRFLSLDIEQGRIRTVADLSAQPRKMGDYFKCWWEEIAPGSRKDVKDLIGYLLVARGPLPRFDLASLSPLDEVDSFNVDDAIDRIDRYLVGDEESGYELCHPRFRDYLTERIVVPKDQAKYRGLLLEYCTGWQKSTSRYPVAYHARHLIDAVRFADAVEQGGLIDRLVRLLASHEFHVRYMERIGDFGALELDMRDALGALAAATTTASPSGTLVQSLALVAARKNWLQPEKIFELAERGDIEIAERRLDHFEIGWRWRQAALVAVAWSALKDHAGEARGFLDRHAADLEQAAMPSLIIRVRALADGSPEPVSTPPYSSAWPPYPPIDAFLGQAIVERLGGRDLGEAVQVSGFGNLADKSQYGDEVMSYVAEADAPPLVDLAIREPGVGVPLLKEYIAIHAANPYREYRDRALWAVLGAAVCHGDSAIALDLVRTIVSMALRPGAADYREGLFLALEAVSAPDAFEAHAVQAESAAASVGPGRGGADSWGHHCRRLAVVAEIRAVVGKAHRAGQLLDLARGLPFGFAGFQAPASLALAEANRICRADASTAADDAVRAALVAAHNIQEPPFCAAMTARINAIARRWNPARAVADLPGVIGRLVADRAAPEFSSVHLVGEAFDLRSETDQHLLIPPSIFGACTLRRIADAICGLPVADLARVNPDVAPDAVLSDGFEVNLPDAGFAPFIATRLAAEAVTQRAAGAAHLLAMLVPVAVTNPTALDAILARLVMLQPDTAADALGWADTLIPRDWMVDPARPRSPTA